VTLGTATASVTFSSIPATYRDLVIVTQARPATADSYFRMRFNSDTGSNYTMVHMMGWESGTGVQSNTSTENALDLDYFGNALTTVDNTHNIQIMDYSATDKHKTTLVSRKMHGASSSVFRVGPLAARWADTSAITSISIFLNSGNIASGSTFNLYGVIA
jgi:hypothetical protein